MEEYTALLSDTVKKKGLPFRRIMLSSPEEVRKFGSPFGTFGLYYNGRFVTHELMAENKFEKLLETLL